MSIYRSKRNCRKLSNAHQGHLKLSVFEQSSTLVVHIFEARGLVRKYENHLAVYVKLYILPDLAKTSKKKTHVVKQLDPVFNQKFTYLVSAGDHEKTLFISVWMQHMTHKNHLIGCISFKIGDLIGLDKGLNGWYELTNEPKGDVPSHYLDSPTFTSYSSHPGSVTSAVTLPRGDHGFGFEVQGHNPVKVVKVEGLAAQQADIEVGDVVVEVGETNVRNASAELVQSLIERAKETLHLILHRSSTPPLFEPTSFHSSKISSSQSCYAPSSTDINQNLLSPRALSQDAISHHSHHTNTYRSFSHVNLSKRRSSSLIMSSNQPQLTSYNTQDPFLHDVILPSQPQHVSAYTHPDSMRALKEAKEGERGREEANGEGGREEGRAREEEKGEVRNEQREERRGLWRGEMKEVKRETVTSSNQQKKRYSAYGESAAKEKTDTTKTILTEDMLHHSARAPNVSGEIFFSQPAETEVMSYFASQADYTTVQAPHYVHSQVKSSHSLSHKRRSKRERKGEELRRGGEEGGERIGGEGGMGRKEQKDVRTGEVERGIAADQTRSLLHGKSLSKPSFHPNTQLKHRAFDGKPKLTGHYRSSAPDTTMIESGTRAPIKHTLGKIQSEKRVWRRIQSPTARAYTLDMERKQIDWKTLNLAAQKRQMVLHTLEMTQSAFSAALRNGTEVYLEPLRGVLSDSVHKLIFINLKELCDVSADVTSQMKARHLPYVQNTANEATPYYITHIADIYYFKLSALVELLDGYLRNLHTANQELSLAFTIEEFSSYVQSCVLEKKQRNVYAFVEAGHEYLPRLFKSLLEVYHYTPTSHPDHNYLSSLLSALTSICPNKDLVERWEREQKTMQNLEVCIAFGSKLPKIPIAIPGRSLLLEGAAFLVGNHRKRKVWLLLFSDIFLLTQRHGKLFTCIETAVYLEGLTVDDYNCNRDTEFQISSTDMSLTHLLRMSSVSEKEQWMAILMERITKPVQASPFSFHSQHSSSGSYVGSPERPISGPSQLMVSGREKSISTDVESVYGNEWGLGLHSRSHSHDALQRSHRTSLFGGSSGTEKKRSSKKQSPSRTRSAKPPGLTLDRIDPQTLCEWEKSFEALLRSKEGSQLFEEFLKSEFSEENILFWRACEDYRSSPESALAYTARSIFDEFISQEASKLVNIDHQTTKEIIESMKNPTRDTFAKAQHSIYLLMARDSYVRFIKSDPFKAALSN